MSRYLLPAVLLLCALSSLSAQELVNLDQANPPFSYLDKEGAAGPYLALFKEAFRRMGVEANIDVLPWARALAAADAGRAGIGGIYMNTERRGKYDFSDPFYEERIALFVPAGKEFRYRGIEDLSGKLVAGLSGWSYGDAFDAAVKAGRIELDASSADDLVNFRKLGQGRVDVVIDLEDAGRAAMATLGLEGRVTMLPTLFSVNKVYLAYSKTRDKGALLAAFNKAINDMRREGVIDAIMRDAFRK